MAIEVIQETGKPHAPRYCAICGRAIKGGNVYITRKITYTDKSVKVFYAHLTCYARYDGKKYIVKGVCH